MPRPNCPYARGPLYPGPGPLYSRGERRNDEPAPVPAAAPILTLSRPGGAEEMRIRRHTHPIPTPAFPAQGEILCLLRRQNELLMEILASINSLTAATLAKN